MRVQNESRSGRAVAKSGVGHITMVTRRLREGGIQGGGGAPPPPPAKASPPAPALGSDTALLGGSRLLRTREGIETRSEAAEAKPSTMVMWL